eukprot:1484561-Rhodomonas_salina.1
MHFFVVVGVCLRVRRHAALSGPDAEGGALRLSDPNAVPDMAFETQGSTSTKHLHKSLVLQKPCRRLVLTSGMVCVWVPSRRCPPSHRPGLATSHFVA